MNIRQYTIKHCSTYKGTALDPLAVRTTIDLQLLDDIYKLLQLRLAVPAVKALLLSEDLYKLS